MVMVAAQGTRLTNEVALSELEAIRQRNGGILEAAAVVDAAADPASPLHGQFEWDDNAAAAQWRLQQARQLIRTVLVIIPNYSKPVTAYVSLRDDRTKENGGYRDIITVMSDKDMRERLVAEALEDLRHWQEKYAQLEELKPIFDGLKILKKRVR